MFKKRKVNDQQTTLNLNEKQPTANQSERESQAESSTLQSQYLKKTTPIQKEQEVAVESDNDAPGSEPKKKVKPNVISASTEADREKKNQELHKQFKSLTYEAAKEPHMHSTDESQSVMTLKLEEEIAKEKYMANIAATKLIKEGSLDPKVYRGINNYANYALTEDEIVNAEQKYRKIAGPSRINSTIRNTSRFDYNFGLCKDWHDSGYCPFGDSCIYLHDRSNYKTGWEQEKDFERAEKERWKRINNPELAIKEDLEESLKSIEKYKVEDHCKKCSKQFMDPVEVDCSHLFCTGCALKMDKCVICKKKLSGIMNSAEKKLMKMKETYEELKAKILKENEDRANKHKKTEGSSLDVFAVTD